ncbi:hypothetical protein FH972_027197 [Carpinus fangiana]|uniref:Uncharacterized protein n=1 Tax=Carpinus fangiana TaxID=176857 RepID=A0A5N6L8R3_9ROSI|nr:hypothetical protein FH972_027197 [Carpinus fangiana]
MGTQLTVSFTVSFAVFLISLATNVSAAAATLDGNTSFSWTVSEFIGEEGVPLMESEVSRSLLGIHLKDPLKRPPVCNAKIYGNCIMLTGDRYRPCDYFNRCKRG